MLDLAPPGSRRIRVAPSSIVQARDRLGDEPLRYLFVLERFPLPRSRAVHSVYQDRGQLRLPTFHRK